MTPKNKDKDTETKIIHIENTQNKDVDNKGYILLEIYGKKIGNKTNVSKDGVTIGRSPDCDIPVNDSGASRVHLRIATHKGNFHVMDLNSTNGTYLNDQKVSGLQSLENGDKIRLGRTVFKFICSDDLEAEYYDQIYQVAIRDGLTGLYNKKTLYENLEKEIKRSVRYNRPLSFLMTDIDHFKAVNDTYGHLAGDKVLTALSKVLQQYVRRADFVYRFGGEEFSIILPETSIKGAILTAERIRMAASKLSFKEDGHTFSITISIGVCEHKKEYSTATEFIKKADELLYKAKKNGRDRVEDC